MKVCPKKTSSQNEALMKKSFLDLRNEFIALLVLSTTPDGQNSCRKYSCTIPDETGPEKGISGSEISYGSYGKSFLLLVFFFSEQVTSLGKIPRPTTRLKMTNRRKWIFL